ncbi:LacI family DNA-binding transcriptional regulator [Paramaledivibacter caminithermalis]|jgi:LacI family transcriptional regulator|uniref:Transcriptional regulator, LacI family n=1 Tax=Paramaledivibacter caminithermalis (strain DSM 15212 / CIP 107654 / DViRD3) TaxID=1121301 RepID=A0A1M6LNU0_PARC5|nr:LacI family DNA-binding transcriptional regulator [Paramaledivibacter caminithermalis]SHJ72813.1 transcriptional regulator, LacI family [Paramaledivibacter caminithermalis DSM 15212]
MKNLNIRDIAKIAGVGVSTVSRVINNHPDVKERTREKVLQIIEQYNYIPNNSARNLKRSDSKNIGVLVKGIHNPFFSKIVQSIEEKIDKEGYSLILHYSTGDCNDIEAAIELIKEKKLKGLICLGGDFDNLNKSQLIDLKIPIVLSSTSIFQNENKDNFSSVIIENEEAAFKAVDYLCKLGHRKIGIIATGEGDKSIGRLRLKGYKKALHKNNMKYNAEFLEIGEYTFQSAFNAMNRLLDKDLGLTAVFATSDIMAIGASKAILKRGLNIPDDISVIGFDGIEYAEFFHPSITTIKQPGEYMGEKSVEILFDLIKKKGDHRHIILETKLLERESCKKLVQQEDDV